MQIILRSTIKNTEGISADKQFLQEWKNRHPVVLYLILSQIESSNQMLERYHVTEGEIQ